MVCWLVMTVRVYREDSLQSGGLVRGWYSLSPAGVTSQLTERYFFEVESSVCGRSCPELDALPLTVGWLLFLRCFGPATVWDLPGEDRGGCQRKQGRGSCPDDR